jgi:hypothetical protein
MLRNLYHHGLKKVKAKQTSTYLPIQSKAPAPTYSTTRPRRPLTPFVPPVTPAYSDADIDSGGRRGNILQETNAQSRLSLQSSELGPTTPSPAGECVPTGGETHSLAGEGLEDPNSDDGPDIVVL